MKHRYVACGEVGVANHKIAPTAVWLWGPDVPATVSAHPGMARPLASSQGLYTLVMCVYNASEVKSVEQVFQDLQDIASFGA